MQSPPHIGPIAQISTGRSGLPCAVTTAGEAWCWGGSGPSYEVDSSGGPPEAILTPVHSVPLPVGGGLSFASVSVGFDQNRG